MSSRREDIIDTLVTELMAIKTADGYRTDPVQVIKTDLGPHEINVFPTILVWVGPEEWNMDDMLKSVISSDLKITLQGYYRADQQEAGSYDVTAAEVAGEALMQDMKRVVYAFLLKYVNSATNRWIVRNKPTIRWEGPFYSRDQRKGLVQCTLMVKILFQDGTF